MLVVTDMLNTQYFVRFIIKIIPYFINTKLNGFKARNYNIIDDISV